MEHDDEIMRLAFECADIQLARESLTERQRIAAGFICGMPYGAQTIVATLESNATIRKANRETK